MSSYILDLRKLVGHRPLLQVGVSVIVEDKEKKGCSHMRGCIFGYIEIIESSCEVKKVKKVGKKS